MYELKILEIDKTETNGKKEEILMNYFAQGFKINSILPKTKEEINYTPMGRNGILKREVEVYYLEKTN